MYVYAIIVPAYANRVDQICVYEAPINYMTSLVYGHTHDDNWPSYLTSVGCRHTHAAIRTLPYAFTRCNPPLRLRMISKRAPLLYPLFYRLLLLLSE